MTILGIPRLLQITLGQYTDPIFKAGQRVGELMERDRHRPWWRGHPTEIEMWEIAAAHKEYSRAFKALYDFLEQKLREP